MKPDRELDALVAKKVTGKGERIDVKQDPNSNSWSVLKLTKYGINYIATGASKAHAICLAALKAVKGWPEQ